MGAETKLKVAIFFLALIIIFAFLLKYSFQLFMLKRLFS
jgi:hypothetical protein